METDLQWEAEPAANFLEHLFGDDVLDRIELSFEISFLRIEPAHQVADRHGADFDNRLAADAHGPGLRIEPLSAASRAANDAHVLFQLQAARPCGCFLETAQELRDDPFPFVAMLPDA